MYFLSRPPNEHGWMPQSKKNKKKDSQQLYELMLWRDQGHFVSLKQTGLNIYFGMIGFVWRPFQGVPRLSSKANSDETDLSRKPNEHKRHKK